MKGILLAGGAGTRLHPLTLVVSKQLLPIYNKPMVYYPLSTLMLAGMREILLISTPATSRASGGCLATADTLACEIEYAVQPRPEGLAQSFVIGREFIGASSCRARARRQHFLRPRVDRCAAIGRRAHDWRHGLRLHRQRPRTLWRRRIRHATAARWASSRSRNRPKSSWAVTGLYFYDNQVVDIADVAQALGPGRARDYRRQSRVPRTRRAARRAPRARHRLARHGHLRGAAPCGEFRSEHRGAAGADDGVPRRNRVPDGIHLCRRRAPNRPDHDRQLRPLSARRARQDAV